MRACIAVLLALVVGAPREAVAQDGEPFGSAGQWSLGGSLGASYDRPRSDPRRAHEAQSLAVWVAPEVTAFVATDLALGIRNEGRRDRLIFIAAIAHMLVTLLRAAVHRCCGAHSFHVFKIPV